MGVLALDFDGVICDSAAETAVTAWRAGRELWPEWRGQEPTEDCLTGFVELRPVLETGFEAILLMRLVYDGVAPATVRADFPGRCAALMQDLSTSRADLVRLFGSTRDRWIAADLRDWLGRHRFYPGVLPWLQQRLETQPVYILTTKQERFVLALLESGGVELSADRVFGLDAGKTKIEVLHLLSETPTHRGTEILFVEDRLAALRRVTRETRLDHVSLLLAKWGYNTPEERAEAAASARIRVAGIETFLNDPDI
jgi:phosphoglycolate phosphatase-like HAD superfamily hydrolase